MEFNSLADGAYNRRMGRGEFTEIAPSRRYPLRFEEYDPLFL